MRDDSTPLHDGALLPTPPPPPPASAFEEQSAARQPIAHWAHTLALFGVLLLTTFFGHSRTAEATLTNAPRIPRYVSSILLEWLLLGSVIAGIYHRRAFFVTTLRNRTMGTMQHVASGVAVYFMGVATLGIVAGALYYTPLFHKRNEAVVLAMLPHTPLEFLFWFGVSLSAGVCEELIFRGYLLRQLTAWTGRPVLAIVLGGLFFGSVHLYEGVGAILPLAALGILFGFTVRFFKGDVRAAIVAHTLQDFLVAFLVFAKPLLDKHGVKP